MGRFGVQGAALDSYRVAEVLGLRRGAPALSANERRVLNQLLVFIQRSPDHIAAEMLLMVNVRPIEEWHVLTRLRGAAFLAVRI